MPRIKKPTLKVGATVWMKNFGWPVINAFNDVKKVGWVKGTIVDIKHDNKFLAYFPGFVTNRSLKEDNSWFYNPYSESCNQTQYSLTEPKED